MDGIILTLKAYSTTCIASGIIYGILPSSTGTLFLTVAYFSPHWLQSYLHAYGEFVRLGLWEICFNQYFHHSFQIHHAFSGCHWVHSKEYRVIYEFVQPPWFLAVQGFMTVALLFSSSSTAIFALSHFWPTKFRMRTKLAVFSNISTVGCLLIALATFGARANDQKWMPHQWYNYFSWSFWLAFVSLLIHCAVTIKSLIVFVHKQSTTVAHRVTLPLPVAHTDPLLATGG